MKGENVILFKLIRSILRKNEKEAYTHLANINFKSKSCHVKGSGLPRIGHAYQSIACGVYFLKMALFCLFWHPIFPNIKSNYATKKLDKFYVWYRALNIKLKKVFDFDIPNPFDSYGV